MSTAMKNIYLTFFCLFSVFIFGQFNKNAPWNVSTADVVKTNLFEQEVTIFNNYWLNKDRTKKGSGFKPFKRWEYHWQNQLNADGTIMTPQQLWEAWNTKKNRSTNRSSTIQSLPPSNWEPVGPFTHTNTGSWSSGQGRVNVVAVDPSNPTTIYIGAPAGGIWKSTNSGSSWIPLSDELPQIGVSGIAVDPTNSNIIYIATGDRDASDTYSVGVLKSTNGGISWNTTGLSFTGTSNFAGDLIIHPTNNQIILCATSAGVYRTIDGGTTWTVEQSGDFSQGSIRFKPTDPTIVYATSNNKFYKSTNTGDTFTNITSGLSASGSTGRMILDVTPANSNYVYILSVNTSNALNGIYQSTNSGTSFNKTSGTTDILESTQSWYDLALAVSPTNANVLFTGCLNIWKSSNSGSSVTKVNNWSAPSTPTYTHADIHFLQFLNGKLYCGSDGGVYVSEDNGLSFNDLTGGLQISQFYKISVSKQSSGKMVGGLQDNGGYAFSNAGWKNFYGADGMDAAVSQSNSNLYYGFIQFGNPMYISNNGGNSITGSVGSPGGVDGNWVTPIKSDGQGAIYSGFNGLFKLVNGAWSQQNTNSVGSGNIELISIAPSNDAVIFVANDNVLYKSTNGGVTFTAVYTASSSITGITVHYSNTNIVYITTSGVSGEALKSTDGGTTFVSIAPGLPSISKNCIVHQGRNSTNPLYVGTALGVYYIDDTMSTWQAFDTNLPNVSIADLEINLEDAKIVAATYGRGIWQTNIPVEIPALDLKFVSVTNPTININCTASVTPQIVVKNGGQNTISSVAITYLVDNTPNSFNWSGTIASGANQLIDIPSFTTNRGAHTLSFTTTTTGDAFSDNNTGGTTFYVNDSGTVGVTNNFTTVSDELIVITEGGNGWTRGNRTSGLLATNGNTAYVTNTSGNYTNNTKSYLISQCYNLSTVSNPTINFKLAFDLEQDWDIAYVEYSTDFGANWTVLGTMGTGWYNSDRTPQTSGTDCYNCVGAQWTGTNTTLSNYSASLAALNAETNVIFRIVFHSDEGVNQLGINVDDFVISGSLNTEDINLNAIQIAPNPTSSSFKIFFQDIIPSSIEIFDVTGKIIYTKKNHLFSNEVEIDLNEVSVGLYFIKITSTEQKIYTERIIKK